MLKGETHTKVSCPQFSLKIALTGIVGVLLGNEDLYIGKTYSFIYIFFVCVILNQIQGMVMRSVFLSSP